MRFKVLFLFKSVFWVDLFRLRSRLRSRLAVACTLAGNSELFLAC